LFTRKGRYIELTPAGEYFVQHSKSIADDIDALRRNTALVYDGVEREVTVAFNNIVPQYVLADFAADFALAFPATQLCVTTEVYNGCWDALYAQRADLVVGAPHAVPRSDGIVSQAIGQMTWDFVVGARHPLASGDATLRNSEVRGYPAACIRDTSVDFSPRQAWLLDGQQPMYLPDFHAAITLIARNTCIGILPAYLCRPFLVSGTLIKKTLLEQKHDTRLFLAWRAEAQGPVRQWCVDYLTRPEVCARLCGA